MRVVLQRVSKAECVVNNELTGKIDKGYLLFVGFTDGDDETTIEKSAKKISKLRVFEDENGKMNLDIYEVKGSILSISQFTLYANTEKGNRPSFVEALNPVEAEKLYSKFNQKLRELNLRVEEGIFGEHMDIKLINDGPVTIIFEF
ncbi:MAG TPA: D-tyrosyl-tRNA(Tyr) deacylase [Acholeplasmataceae bacterium]|nr:D-tyrosyl-tRNA(Tyr) deacylase [Acholeplasmataceae bacterium]